MAPHKQSILKKLERDLDTLTSPEGYLYAGAPTKFMGLFGRDSMVSGWQLLDYDPHFAKHALLALAEIQGKKLDSLTGEEPGKIPHEFYSKSVPESWFIEQKKDIGWLQIEKPVYFSVDSTPLFLMILGKYYSHTGDIKLINTLKPNMERAIDWILNYGIIDTFLRYKEIHPEEGLVSQSWKDGIGKTLERQQSPIAIVEVQGYLLEAYQEIKKLEPLLGHIKRLEEFEAATQKILEAFHKQFWMTDKNFYCLGLDGNNRQIRSLTSNPGQLLFTDILSGDQANKVVKRIFMEDMWTPYGIRTHSILEPDFDPLSYQRGTIWPHDNWIIARGLIKQGYLKEAARIKEALFNAYSKLGFLPELYAITLKGELTIENLETPPVYIQAWSVGAMINFLTSPIVSTH